MPLILKKAVLGCKVEVTQGTAIALTATDYMLVTEPRIDFDISKFRKSLNVLDHGCSRHAKPLGNGLIAGPAPAIFVAVGAKTGQHAERRRTEAPILDSASGDDREAT